jgi:hypothetical protein
MQLNFSVELLKKGVVGVVVGAQRRRGSKGGGEVELVGEKDSLALSITF